MYQENYNILNLLERCIFNNDSIDNQAWNEFVFRFKKSIKKKAAYALSKTTTKTNKSEMISDFSFWFLTYLFNNQNRFNSAYKKLFEKTKNGELANLKEQEKYFINYLGKIISTDAKIKYFKETESKEKSLDEEIDEDSGKTYHDIVTVKNDDVFELKSQKRKMDVAIKAIEKLGIKKSVVLILKSKVLYTIVKLSKEQLEWIAEQSNLSSEEVEKKIEKEFWSNTDEKYDIFDENQSIFPLSSKFIAKLLGLTVTNVDQITKRALEELQSKKQE